MNCKSYSFQLSAVSLSDLSALGDQLSAKLAALCGKLKADS
jgi:hypothetical protein